MKTTDIPDVRCLLRYIEKAQAIIRSVEHQPLMPLRYNFEGETHDIASMIRVDDIYAAIRNCALASIELWRIELNNKYGVNLEEVE
jgi:hypothetical protein